LITGWASQRVLALMRGLFLLGRLRQKPVNSRRQWVPKVMSSCIRLFAGQIYYLQKQTHLEISAYLGT
jgi:hypothetical protein